jgi:hypothetical protein
MLNERFINVIKKSVSPSFFEVLKFIYSYGKYFSYRRLIQKNERVKNIHKGERCFILGSGPSIANDELTALEDEVVFTTNNFYVHTEFDKIMSGISKKYHIVAPIHAPQTELEWTNWLIEMDSSVKNNVTLLFGINANKPNIKDIVEKNKLFKSNKCFWYFPSRKFNYRSSHKLGLDFTKPIYTGEAVSLYAIMMAIYMGFDEIILLGMDHDYFLYDKQSEMRMYKAALHQDKEIERVHGNDFCINELYRQHIIFKKYRALDKKANIKIFNASSGGILSVFERVPLKSFF